MTCENFRNCLKCTKTEYYLENGECIDCKNETNREKCFYLKAAQFYLDQEFTINSDLVFNRDFNAVEKVEERDLFLSYPNASD